MQKQKILQSLFGMHDLFELVCWILPSGGVGTIVGGVMNALGLSPMTITMFSVGAFLLALSFLPRVKGIRRLFGLAADRTGTNITSVIGMKAKNQTISLDGKSFQNCEFEACTFLWNGGPYELRDCNIPIKSRFETHNQVVLQTIETLRFLKFLDPQFAASWRRLPREHFDSMQGKEKQ